MKLTGLLLCFVLLSCSSAQKNEKSQAEGTPSAYLGHGAESVSPETLKKYAPRQVDAEWISRVQKLLDIRGAGGGVLSLDGRKMFYSTSVTGTSQVWTISGPMGFQKQMTAGQDSSGVLTITPNGKDLVISRDRNGEENPGLYLMSVDGGELRTVFHKPKVRASASYVSSDSRYLYFTANSESPESYAIHRYDLQTQKSEVLFKEPGTWSIADVKNDREFLLSKATGSLWVEYYLWSPEDKKLTPLLGQNEKEEYGVSFAAQDGAFLVQTPKFGDFRRLYLFKSGKWTPVTPDVKKDLDGFSIDHQRKRIYLSWNDQGYSQLEIYDAKTLKPIAFSIDKNAEHTYAIRMSRDGRYLVYAIETAQAPRTVYVHDWATGKSTKWLEPSTPETNTARFVRARLDHYMSRDGVKIPMFIREPAACAQKLCPVIVHFHGGPEAQSTPGFSPYIQSFIDAGFIFAEPNVRGSDGYGKNWLAMDDGAKRLNVITDIEDASIELKKRYARNGQVPKIGVMGGSYGGYSTLYAMTKFAGAYDAGVSNVGMSNLITFLNNTAPYRRHLRISEYGDPVKDEKALIELSPVTHIDRLKSPLMIIQGATDPRVPVGEAIQMHEKLKARGVQNELVIYADEGHGSAKRENRASQLALTLEFFVKHLK